MNIALTDEQVLDAVRAVVDEEMPEAVRDAVLTHANTVIKEAVYERIRPVVERVLTTDQFVYGRIDAARSLDDMVRGAIKSYLDERVYLYSETSDVPSVRLAKASYDQRSGITRLEGFLRFSIERFCDEYLNQKLEATAKAFLDERGGIEQVAKEQMAALLKEKFKL
jgi:hypothetical protein